MYLSKESFCLAAAAATIFAPSGGPVEKAPKPIVYETVAVPPSSGYCLVQPGDNTIRLVIGGITAHRAEKPLQPSVDFAVPLRELDGSKSRGHETLTVKDNKCIVYSPFAHAFETYARVSSRLEANNWTGNLVKP